MLAEVDLRRDLDAVGVVVEVRNVQVRGEQLIRRHLVLDVGCEAQLLDLTPKVRVDRGLHLRLVLGLKYAHVLHVLLRERRCALQPAAAGVVQQSPQRSARVERALLEERSSSIATIALRMTGAIWSKLTGTR